MKKQFFFIMILTALMLMGSKLKAAEVREEDGFYYGYEEDTLIQGSYDIEGHRYYFQEDGTALTNSWKKVDGRYYYFGEDGKALTGIQHVGKHIMGFSDTGERLNGLYINNDSYYYFNRMGASEKGLYEIEGEQYYFNGDGTIVKNQRKTIEGITYLFDEDGLIVRNRLYDASALYEKEQYLLYLDENGQPYTGILEVEGILYAFNPEAESGYETGWKEVEHQLYYFQEDGTALTDSWLTIEEKHYCFQSDGTAYRSQLVQLEDNYYYFQEDGSVATGYQRIVDENQTVSYFYFDAQGISLTGLYTLPDSNSTRYFNGDGTILRSQFVTVDEKLYFLTSEGIVYKGNWRNIGVTDLNTASFYIHCDTEGVVLQGPMWITREGKEAFYYMDVNAPKGFRSGVQEIEGKLYGFSADSGKALKGVKVIEEDVYYFQDDHTAYTGGWITIGTKQYYFREDGRGYLEELVILNENPYYFTAGGYIQTNGYRNVTTETGKQYYFYDENGISMQGLIDVPSTTYSRYFNGDGTVLTSTFQEIDGTLYFFTNAGILYRGNWRNAGKYDLNYDYDLYIHSDENGVIAQGYTQFVRDEIDVVYYFDRNVEFGHRLGLVDCGERGTMYFLKSKTYGYIAKGILSDPETQKTYFFDEETGILEKEGSLNIAGTDLEYQVQEDGTLNLDAYPITEADDQRTKLVKLCMGELYKTYSHEGFSQNSLKKLEEITGYSCSGFAIRLYYELLYPLDFFERNSDLMYQIYLNRENGLYAEIWSKDYDISNLVAGDLVVVNKYDCYEDVDDVGDPSIIDLNGDGICDREHEPFMSNDDQLISLHVHHIGIYLGDGYYINSVPGKGVCIQKLPQPSDVTEISAYARVLKQEG